ncbi:DUF2252 domain-containing protein [Phycicoccus sonneratiae]|uniref:DUF2252 domain-containing protein n=1 Tax=Phycicoccus sonneratiae TaxID=2807628 RepID=A0ABS2CI79_9MICO|nr:DUF2252 domain-containing protein [Phycicoccus sonneraticus]MBM6399569.1 DUF2252 domain-containing protein [Phycicoccus sonneraticus]
MSQEPRGDRTALVVDTLLEAFEPLMRADPHGFRTKFRKMARDPFAFYRGSACLFYADVGAGGRFADFDVRWVDDASSRVWVQGDLHAENFGTYLDADGRLVFDVNDFDEAYLGHWTWDLARFVASLSLMCWQKALPETVVDDLVATYVRAYLDQVEHYREVADDTEWALTLETGEGAVLDALHRAKLTTRVGLLESMTVVEDFRRRFADGPGVRRLEPDEEDSVRAAFDGYRHTLPTPHRDSVTFDVLDVVGRSGFGIGSAGLPAYSVLIEGFTQALDNDVVLSMKQGNVAAPSRVVDDERGASYFEHHGHRTAISQRALQAHADRFLGWTSLAGRDGPVGFVVSEVSPYEADLSWDEVTEPGDLEVLVPQLGRATAKIHCVADSESDQDLVAVSVEDAVGAAVGGDVDGLVTTMREFAREYSEQAREDHRLFVDAFRGGSFEHVAPA